MPRKVITRRQRKAALDLEIRKQIELENNCKKININKKDIKPSLSTNVQPSNSGPSSKPTVQGLAEAADKQSEKTTDKVIFNDKNVSSDKKVIDQLVDKFINKETIRIVKGLQTTAGPHIEQASFSKSLTRRAAATLLKMKKMAKHFNKKPSSRPPSDKNKSCNCNFCNEVFHQILITKDICKNPSCPKNQSSEESTGQQDLKEICEECNDREDRQRFWELMNINEQEVNKSVRKKIQELTKITSGNKLQTDNRNLTLEPKSITKTKEAINKDLLAFKLQFEKNKRKKLSLRERCSAEILRCTEPAEFNQPKSNVNQVDSNKKNFFNVMQQLTALQVDGAPLDVQVIGDTGYFVLSGTDAQLTTQFNEIRNRNISVQKCFLLTDDTLPELTIAEVQLELLYHDRKEILEEMTSIHNMVAPQRKIRQKKQRQFPKL